MAWFWGSKKGDVEEEYSEEEYSSEELDSDEYTTDDEGHSDHDEESHNLEEEENTDLKTPAKESKPSVVEKKKEVQVESVDQPPPQKEETPSLLDTDTPKQKEPPEVQPPQRHQKDELSTYDDSIHNDFPIGEESSESESLETSDEDDLFGSDDDLSFEHVAHPDEKRSGKDIRVITVASDDDDDDESESESDVEDDEHDSAEEDEDDDEDEEEDKVTSFDEKQSLLILAAEHDRVDILKAILTDEEDDKNALMNSGIPPLHIGISFGSTNATQSLLRMGADPSIRPNVAKLKQERQKEVKTGEASSKAEVANMNRFDGLSAWELAFGNAAYEAQSGSKPSSWSLFGSSSSSIGDDRDHDKIIKPVDMAPSKREGIRHAFTAESLRCIGGDEVDRLEQLIESGMPPSIDIGGKDLYGWAVEMGALHCEELLRPAEAAKHRTRIDAEGNETSAGEGDDRHLSEENGSARRNSFRVLDRARPGDESSIHQLINRLDELESLASALSTCLDNLAEEVSVCHGLLLMGGGATALASHVKSLKNLQDQKQTTLIEIQRDWQNAEDELADLAQTAGDIGRDVARMAPTKVVLDRVESYLVVDSSRSPEQEASQRRELMAQVAASENKIRKLRASIADLSEENAKEMAEVEKRGLTGGINLVRGLREEIRDVDFQITEASSATATCNAKINMIHSRLPTAKEAKTITVAEEVVAPPIEKTLPGNGEDGGSEGGSVEETSSIVEEDESMDEDEEESIDEDEEESSVIEEQESESNAQVPLKPDTREKSPIETDVAPKSTEQAPAAPAAKVPAPEPISKPKTALARALPGNATKKMASERIATGDSKALALRQSGKQGYFTLDIWQVLMRIIGLERAATRRGVQVSQQQQQQQQQQQPTANLMIV